MEEIDKYAERNVAWNVLGQTAERITRNLEQDANYLAHHGEVKFSEQLGQIASFYDNMSIFASQEQTRMKGLLDRSTQFYGRIVKAGIPDVEGVSEQIVKKMLNFTVSMSKKMDK